MFRSGPPRLSSGAGSSGAPLRLAGAHRLSFDDTSVTALDPLLRTFVTDMVAPFGLQVREDLLVEGAGHSFGEMAMPLIEALTSDEEPVDLLVLAFGMHDLRLGRATATFLSHRCPGQPFAFAVCDQATAAPFTSLRLIDAYRRTGQFRRALLIVAEQSALHYELAAPAPVPQRHAAVALLLDGVGDAELRPVRQRTQVAAGDVSAVLAEEFAMLAAGPEASLVLGEGIDPAQAPAVAELVLAPAGQPVTGPWWQLAGGLTDWAEQQRRVLVADYDRQLGYLSTCVADFAAADLPLLPAESGAAR